jgi:hypothetical protein
VGTNEHRRKWNAITPGERDAVVQRRRQKLQEQFPAYFDPLGERNESQAASRAAKKEYSSFQRRVSRSTANSDGSSEATQEEVTQDVAAKDEPGDAEGATSNAIRHAANDEKGGGVADGAGGKAPEEAAKKKESVSAETTGAAGDTVAVACAGEQESGGAEVEKKETDVAPRQVERKDVPSETAGGEQGQASNAREDAPADGAAGAEPKQPRPSAVVGNTLDTKTFEKRYAELFPTGIKESSAGTQWPGAATKVLLWAASEPCSSQSFASGCLASSKGGLSPCRKNTAARVVALYASPCSLSRCWRIATFSFPWALKPGHSFFKHSGGVYQQELELGRNRGGAGVPAGRVERRRQGGLQIRTAGGQGQAG